MPRSATAIVSIVAAATLFAMPSGADPPQDYERLRAWTFSATPTPVPAAGVSWSWDTATWSLASGRLWVQEATADGTVTGLVFEGEGRLIMEIPDRFELAQLRRFRRDGALERLEYPFTKLVVRGSNLTALPLPLAAPTEVAVHDVAKDRHDSWLERFHVDADARVLAALSNPGAEYLRVDMLTDDDWVTYDYDTKRLEEIWVRTYVRRHSLVESWVSLDRPEERQPDGRPATSEEWPLDLQHLDVTAHMGDLGKHGGMGRSETPSRKTDFSASVRFEVRQDALRALRLFLHPLARVDRVTDAAGRELPFIRDNIGARSRSLDKRLHDRELTVFLAEPTTAGEPLTLRVDYMLEVTNYVSGADWYPTFRPSDVGLIDLHTARIAVTAPRDIEVRAMGVKEGEAQAPHAEGVRSGKLETTVFRIDRPTKMVTFTPTERLIEERLELEGLLPVVVFSSDRGMYEDMLHDTGADLVNSMNYFQQLFASKLPGEELQASMIAAGHGQAFDGMLHLSEYSGIESSVTVPFFRAHEMAHQWWGHQVGWKTYRDQWLSEGFAEYSAMLYMAASLDKGEKRFQEALKVSRDELTGSLKTVFSPFSRPGQTMLNNRAAKRIGPIGHGSRANVGESPGAYFSLAYNKGAYVLHMLRTVLRGLSGSDETFFAILQDFVATYQGTAASTEDFQQVVAKHAPADWSWFFDQWVYRAEIPTYEWDWKQGGKNAEGKTEILLRVRQSGVPQGFKMLVPLRVHFAGGEGGEMLVMIDEPETEVTIALPAPPKKVELNPDHAVLARVKRM